MRIVIPLALFFLMSCSGEKKNTSEKTLCDCVELEYRMKKEYDMLAKENSHPKEFLELDKKYESERKECRELVDQLQKEGKEIDGKECK